MEEFYAKILPTTTEQPRKTTLTDVYQYASQDNDGSLPKEFTYGVTSSLGHEMFFPSKSGYTRLGNDIIAQPSFSKAPMFDRVLGGRPEDRIPEPRFVGNFFDPFRFGVLQNNVSVDPDRVRESFTLSTRTNDGDQTAAVRVPPGLGRGPLDNSQRGLHPMLRVLPKDVDNLYAPLHKKEVYDNQVVPGQVGRTAPRLGDIEKRRPPQFFEKETFRGGGTSKKRVDPSIYLLPTAREQRADPGPGRGPNAVLRVKEAPKETGRNEYRTEDPRAAHGNRRKETAWNPDSFLLPPTTRHVVEDGDRRGPSRTTGAFVARDLNATGSFTGRATLHDRVRELAVVPTKRTGPNAAVENPRTTARGSLEAAVVHNNFHADTRYHSRPTAQSETKKVVTTDPSSALQPLRKGAATFTASKIADRKTMLRPEVHAVAPLSHKPGVVCADARTSKQPQQQVLPFKALGTSEKKVHVQPVSKLSATGRETLASRAHPLHAAQPASSHGPTVQPAAPAATGRETFASRALPLHAAQPASSHGPTVQPAAPAATGRETFASRAFPLQAVKPTSSVGPSVPWGAAPDATGRDTLSARAPPSQAVQPADHRGPALGDDEPRAPAREVWDVRPGHAAGPADRPPALSESTSSEKVLLSSRDSVVTGSSRPLPVVSAATPHPKRQGILPTVGGAVNRPSGGSVTALSSEGSSGKLRPLLESVAPAVGGLVTRTVATSLDWAFSTTQRAVSLSDVRGAAVTEPGRRSQAVSSEALGTKKQALEDVVAPSVSRTSKGVVSDGEAVSRTSQRGVPEVHAGAAKGESQGQVVGGTSVSDRSLREDGSLVPAGQSQNKKPSPLESMLVESRGARNELFDAEEAHYPTLVGPVKGPAVSPLLEQ